MPAQPDGRPERYEPLPGLLSLPAFLVRKLGPRGRKVAGVVAALALAGAVAAAIVLVPEIGETKRDNAAAERRERAEALERERRRLIAEQQPHRAVSAGGDRDAVLGDVEASITADARLRERSGSLDPPPARYSTCEALRGESPDARVSRLSCVAVTSEVPGTEGSEGGVIGHPFRAQVDFTTGRYAWCKVSGRAGEGSFTRSLGVTLPRACGG